MPAPSVVRAHRRPLLTAAAAGGVLCALCFVPSANATPEEAAAGPGRSTAPAGPAQEAGDPALARLAGTHGPGATTYALGAAALVGAGGALVLRSRRSS